ncbi:GNAT family N-acetyltransferase [Aliiroseovarius sp. S1339]|uniref:GNAT family N-acetyltransferase n=1 Tax=Aliiroseovarius sp. S1339 TaxID=2936990 RepID=UPI0020BF440D|nr:GNAT family N-acetyltransferase [Aliiroseovarius sp. S1339]MCK8464648.1 GNAT family N-acetyltransferase [Aliiroseovarius sp. S1339]
MADLIRPVRRADLAQMNAMILRAKAHWGYDAAFMEAVVDELTITPDDLGPDLVIWHDRAPLGMAHVSVDGATAQLEDLFVDPSAMGQGIGAALFQWAAVRARTLGARVLRIDSDPFALPFYQHMGAIVVGEVPSGSIPGRMLPLLDYGLDVHDQAPQS